MTIKCIARQILSVALVLTVFLTVLPMAPPAAASVTPSSWAVPEMNDANTSGLLTPRAARDFLRPLTRDEFCELVVEMVERTLGRALPVPATNPFTEDAEPISIHALKAWNYGIITGMTPTWFAPERNVERQQLCAMMIRAIRGLERDLNTSLLSPGLETLTYRDANRIYEYAIEPIKLAYTNGIMHGDGQGNFFPRDDVSSQECVAVIIRTFNRMEEARAYDMSASQRLDLAENRVRIGYAYGDNKYGVTQNVTLPLTSTGGATVTWSSSDSGVVSISGETGIVNVGSHPRTVTLTATISLGNTTRTKLFEMTTSLHTGERLLMENAYAALDIYYINAGDSAGSVTGRVGLPTAAMGLPVTWYSSNPSVVSDEGIVSVPTGNEVRTATLTATISMGALTRTKTFNLTVVNPTTSRGDVALHGVHLGMSHSQVSQALGTARRTISTSSTESWQIYHTNYNNFIAVGFINNRAVAVYSMASGAANQLRNSAGAVITVAQADAMAGISAVSFTDPGDASAQYAIIVYDSASVIGSTRTLLAEGQEQLLFELVNAYRIRNNRSALSWSSKLGAPARLHSSNAGSGNLRQRVRSEGFDDNRYAGGNIVSGSTDAFFAIDQIISNSTGASSMRAEILQSGATVIGAGFASTATGAQRTHFTYALGAVNAITDVTATVQGVSGNISTINVSTGSNVTIVLTMVPSRFNETFEITSSNTSRATVSNITTTNTGATVTVRGVANGSANLVVTGNSSGNRHEIPISVGTVNADRLTLTYLNEELTRSTNVSANANANRTGSQTLVMATGTNFTITATTSSGASVEWARTSGSAANVARSTTNNNGVVTATANTGEITLTAVVRTGASGRITHTIRVLVVDISVAASPQTVAVGGTVTATATVGTLPAGVVYTWDSPGNHLTQRDPRSRSVSEVFTAANPGTARINLNASWSTAQHLGSIDRTVNVTVNAAETPTPPPPPPPEPRSVSINNGSLTGSDSVDEGTPSMQLFAIVLPAGANQSVTWDIDGATSATVSPTGLVTFGGEGPGEITITAETVNGIFGTFTITIVPVVPD